MNINTYLEKFKKCNRAHIVLISLLIGYIIISFISWELSWIFPKENCKYDCGGSLRAFYIILFLILPMIALYAEKAIKYLSNLSK